MLFEHWQAWGYDTCKGTLFTAYPSHASEELCENQNTCFELHVASFAFYHIYSGEKIL